MYPKQKVALVYDRVNKWGGAERVLLSLHRMFPNAVLYTSVYDAKSARWAKVFSKVVTSFLQYIPFAKTNHEFLAPLMPLAFESFDFSNFDLVISVTSEAAKGIKTGPNTIHICYCLTPTRYLWSHHGEYFKNTIFKGMAKIFVFFLKLWDKKAAQRPDEIIAISSVVQKRIKKYYKRNSKIIYPPVNITSVHVDVVKKKEYYLIVSRLVGYKKIDIAIEAFNSLEYPLLIVGSGRDEKKLKAKAKSNIKFVGSVTEKKLARYYQSAKALIMPQEEDFGIVSVEAQSFAVPVIAYKKGGSLDTIIDGATGVFFKDQTPKGLKKTILRFEKMSFKVNNLHTQAKKFSEEKFMNNFARIVRDATR